MKPQQIIIALSLIAAGLFTSCSTESSQANLNSDFRALYAEQAPTDSAATETVETYCDSLKVLMKSEEISKYEKMKIHRLFKYKCTTEKTCDGDKKGKKHHKKGEKKQHHKKGDRKENKSE